MPGTLAGCACQEKIGREAPLFGEVKAYSGTALKKGPLPRPLFCLFFGFCLLFFVCLLVSPLFEGGLPLKSLWWAGRLLKKGSKCPPFSKAAWVDRQQQGFHVAYKRTTDQKRALLSGHRPGVPGTPGRPGGCQNF